MLRELRIKNFRALQQFVMTGLGRVNLLVGTNNSGKTSMLEAIHMLSARSAVALLQAQVRRGELIDGTADRQIDVARLLHGHEITEGGGFLLTGQTDAGPRSMSVGFPLRDELPLRQRSTLEPLQQSILKGFELEDEDDTGSGPNGILPSWLQIEWEGEPPRQERFPVSRRGGVRDRYILDSRPPASGKARGAIVFIANEGLSRDSIVSMFDEIVLTPDETTVMQALHTIEPTIERIAARDATAQARALGAPFRDAHREKAELHAWLAWQDPPGQQLHAAVRAHALPPAPPVTAAFVAWFRRLFDR
jgi:AAA ATPase domain